MRRWPRPPLPLAEPMPPPARRIEQILTILLTVSWLLLPHAAAPAGDLVRAELIAEPAGVAPGQAFWVGLRLAIKEKWHVYWRNPGDSGEAVAIAWQLPAGYAAGPIVWPTPSRIPVAHLVNYGYEREVVLLTEILAPAAGGAAAEIAADVSWLVCEKICIPGSTRVSLALPVAASGAAPQPDPQTRAAFEAARAALPRSAPWPAKLEAGPEWLSLQVTAPGLKPEAVRSAHYFPYADTLIRHAAPQQPLVTKAGLSLKIERSPSAVTLPTEAGGVLVLEEAQGSGYAE